MISLNEPIGTTQNFFKSVMPEYVGWLWIARDCGIRLTEWPNWWHRFWARVLLGWRYECEREAQDGER